MPNSARRGKNWRLTENPCYKPKGPKEPLEQRTAKKEKGKQDRKRGEGVDWGASTKRV